MPFVISADGTRIAYEVRGKGPALLLVDGAMCARNMGPMPALADALSDRFSVYIFDRRGRGESGDTKPWSLAREVADISALLAVMGDRPMVFGISSGALLAAKAAAANPQIVKLALFEGPMIVDGTHAPMPADFVPRINAQIAQGKIDTAVKMFMAYVGMPGFMLWIMPLMPMWKKITVNGPTLPNDLAIVEPYQQGKPLVATDWAGVTMPTLVLDGGKSPPYMRNSQKLWASVLPDARYDTLAGQTHNVKIEVLAPVLGRFFS